METISYRVGKKIGKTERLLLYECSFSDGSVGILKLSLDTLGDGLLDREAFILKIMKEESEKLEAEFAKTKDNPDTFLNYSLYFPQLVESFKSEDKGGRRINIVSLPVAQDDLGRLVPLRQLREKAQLRIDQKTSGWIMGKLLKLLAFAHQQGIIVGQLTADNILIEKDQHYVMVFDWSEASSSPGGTISPEIAREEIAKLAQEIIVALGGDWEERYLPPDPNVEDETYSGFLFELASQGADDAFETHQQFYRLIRSLWPREFYRFTAYPLS